MAVTIDIIDQDVFVSLVTFFKSFIPAGVEIIQAQENLVAMPKGGFIAMNNVGMDRISFNVDTYSSTLQQKFILTPTNYAMQLDFYGPDSQVWAFETQALFRDEYSTEMFPSNIQPLYADDAIQIPLITGEEKYEQRWSLKANLQYNPIITTDQQSALQLYIEPAPIDQTFTP